MRLIDADAFSERIKSKMLELQKAIDYIFRERGEVNGKDRLLLEKYGFTSQLIGEQPTISQWIPVSERLPQDNAKVLISTNWGYVGTIRYEAGSSLWDNDVTAWMPLPEPYKEDE